MSNQALEIKGSSQLNASLRLYYLDWLRVMAILAVFSIHSAKIFDFHTTDVFNAVRSPFWSAFRDFNLIWIMPLFFVISGVAVFFSLKPGGTGRFLKTRVTRLLVPLLLIGTFVINSVYVYAVRFFQGQAGGGFLAWYPEYFKGMWGFGGNFALLGHGTHLWYLEYLFVFSLILLPFFLRSKRKIAAGLTRLSRRFENPIALFLLFVPVSLACAGIEAAGLGGIRMTGSWDPVSYIFFFAYGYMIFSNERIQEKIYRYGPAFLVGAVVLTYLHIDAHFGFNLLIPGVTRHDMAAGGAMRPLNHGGWIAVQAFRGFLAWCWMLGLLGVGARLLNFNNRFLAHANEAVLPFYILHHSVILLVGAYVVRSNSGVGLKLATIMAISFAIIMAIYELVVGRINALRFLFGMKTK